MINGNYCDDDTTNEKNNEVIIKYNAWNISNSNNNHVSDRYMVNIIG